MGDFERSPVWILADIGLISNIGSAQCELTFIL